jgi:hypothetical protein
MPERRAPVLAGALVVALLAPVFLLAGWSIKGWALGAVLWVGSQLLGLLFARVGIGDPNLRGSGIVALGMMGRGILVALIGIAVAVSDPSLALAGILVYAAGYTTELAISLTLYFSGEPRR